MELFNQTDNNMQSDEPRKKENTSYWKLIVFVFIVLLVFTQFFDVNISIKPRFGSGKNQAAGIAQNQDSSNLEKLVLPSDGIILPVKWGDFGKQMIEAGVIDKDKFESLYSQRGGLDEEENQLLYGSDNSNLKINFQNSGFVLNLLWAFGLANKNPILEEGPMTQYSGDAGGFASTGGWTISKGNAMDYYSRYNFVVLSDKQQEMVERVSKNIYRPCCGNSTYFPDCNHGMAMLGFLEIMAAQNISEEDMYRAALGINSYWFPETYLTIAGYFEKRGVAWNDLNPKDILGSSYSSALGYQEILKEVEPVQTQGGGGCGV